MGSESCTKDNASEGQELRPKISAEEISIRLFLNSQFNTALDSRLRAENQIRGVKLSMVLHERLRATMILR